MSGIPDRVQREIVIGAEKSCVFSALTEPNGRATWGPVTIEGGLTPGERPVLDFGPQGGGKVRVYIVAFEPTDYFAFRWMQGETDPEILVGDPLERPTTLVEFRLAEAEGGTRVTVTESGFDALPKLEKYAQKSLEGLEVGWTLMLQGLEKSFQQIVPVSDALDYEIRLATTPEKAYATFTDPKNWWAEKVEGKAEAGERMRWDFGQFGVWSVWVEAAEPGRRFAFRKVTDDGDPMGSPTRIDWFFRPDNGGTAMTIRESGFDALPEPERESAFRAAEGLWGTLGGMFSMTKMEA